MRELTELTVEWSDEEVKSCKLQVAREQRGKEIEFMGERKTRKGRRNSWKLCCCMLLSVLFHL
jgi:hypothetical protein